MASRSTISFLRSLHQKKFRLHESCFIMEGPKLIQELLNSTFEISSIYATNAWEPPTNLPVNPELISEKEMEQVSTLQTPNKVLAVVKMPSISEKVPVPSSGLHLLADQVQDPGNLGTIIRIADWFGFESVICSPDTVELYNPKVLQSTMGSIFRVPVHYNPLPDFLMRNAETHKLPVYATLLQGNNIYKEELSNSGLIVMGNESRGMSPLLMPFINKAIHIPGGKKNGEKAESLNVAVAAGVICAEFRRQFPA